MQNDQSLIIGSDHAAYDLKEKIITFLYEEGFTVKDVGTSGYQSVNYVDFGKMVAEAVSNEVYSRGILLCGTGLGMSIVANRYSGVRAVLCSDLFSARMGRMHNDANILVLAGRLIGDVLACEIVRVWLETPFEGGRHLDRIQSIDI